MEQLLNIIGYNTFLVALGAISLGLAGGVVGVLTLQRGQALLSDTIAHAALPGVALVWGISGLSLGTHPFLLLVVGGALTAGLSVLWVLFMSSRRGMTYDLAFAATLSVFYGAGLVVISWVQTLPGVGTAGLSFLFLGQITSLTAQDLWMTAGLALLSSLCVASLYRPLRHLCFDETHAAFIGLPTRWLDGLCLILALSVALCGLYLVGLVLTVAMLILPAASARFWTDDFRKLLFISGGFGAGSGLAGAILSASVDRIPSGPIIVLCGGFCLTISLLRHGFKRAKARRVKLQAI